MWFRVVLYFIFYIISVVISGERYTRGYSRYNNSPDITAPVVNFFKRRNRRISALKKASIYLKPYEKIFGNLCISNKFCSVSLNAKKKTIVCTSKIYNNNGRMMVLGAKSFSPMDIDEYWDLLCEIFSWHTKYEEVYNSMRATAVISESVLRIRPAEEKRSVQLNPPSNSEQKIVEVNFSGRSSLDIPDKVIDVNNCSEAELTALPGISIIIAKKIIKFREEQRPFKSVNDFLSVMKVKPRHAKQLKNLICANKVNMRKVKKAKAERIIDL